MTPEYFSCPVPEHHGTCVLEQPAAGRNALRTETVDFAVVVQGHVTDTFLTLVRDCHPTRHVTLDDDTLVIWPATRPTG